MRDLSHDPPDNQSESTVRHALTGLFGRDTLYMAGWAGQIAIAALATPLITRLMARDEFGLVAGGTAVMQVLFVIAGAGLATAIQRQHGRGKPVDARRLLSVEILIVSAVSLIAYVTGPAWSQALGFPAYSAALQLAVVWAGAGAVTNASLALLRSQDRLSRFLVVGAVQSIGAELTALGLIATLSPSADLFVTGKTAAQGLAMVLGIAFALPALPRLRDRGMVTQSLRFSVPLVPAALSTFVLAAGDRLILQHQLGADSVGAYQVAYNIGSVPILLLGLLSNAWLPRLFSLLSERAQVLAASRDAIYRVLLPVLVGMGIGGPIVLRVWAPASYHPDTLAMTLSIVVICVIPEAAAAASTRTLLTSGRTVLLAIGTGIAAAINIALNFALVPRLGLEGAALATFISLGALWLMLYGATWRILRLEAPPRRLLAWLWGCALVAVASALAPIDGGFLLGRVAVGVLALAWLVLTIRRARALGDAVE